MMGRIFSIEEFATFDGPGIRMTVFLKGCPLRCEWCHNPEGQSFEREYKRNPNGCLRCGACEGVGGGRLVEKSVEVCPRSLVRPCGEDISAQDLCERILKNADILHSTGGGVTFSGGEPLAQAGFVAECAELLKGKVHLAIQTSGYAEADTFTNVLNKVDYVLYDLKLFDPALHARYCGKDNQWILANYRTLAACGKEFITRIPLIPGVTDTEENLDKIASFMSDNRVDRVELLPYNKLTGSKYSSLLRLYKPSFDGAQAVKPHPEIFERHGIRTRVM